MLNDRSASITPSSEGSFEKSLLWYVNTMCRIELAMKTNTAETRMGNQRERIETMVYTSIESGHFKTRVLQNAIFVCGNARFTLKSVGDRCAAAVALIFIVRY